MMLLIWLMELLVWLGIKGKWSVIKRDKHDIVMKDRSPYDVLDHYYIYDLCRIKPELIATYYSRDKAIEHMNDLIVMQEIHES